METIVTFVAGVVIGALSSWLITHSYYVKASADQKAELGRLTEAVRPRITLQDFTQRLETSRWTQRFIDGVEKWVCDDDNTFQIESSTVRASSPRRGQPYIQTEPVGRTRSTSR